MREHARIFPQLEPPLITQCWRRAFQCEDSERVGFADCCGRHGG